MQYNDVQLTLLDSPGFNDTYRSDTEVLDSISTFLSDTYSQGFRLSGIIYLHPISHARMDGSSLRSLRMFRKLVGEDALSNVLLASTHWAHVSAEEGTRREADLRDKFWKPLLDNGAVMTRHTGGAASAMALVDDLIDKSRVVLDIQRELVDERMALIDTAAGSALNEELIALQQRHEKELQEVRGDMEKAVRDSDERAQSELAEVRRQLEEKIETDKRNRTALRERERLAARHKQKLQTQLQLIQLSFVKHKEELDKNTQEREKKFEQERREWKAQVDAANGTIANQNAAAWSHASDFADSAIRAFLVYLSTRNDNSRR